MGDWLTHHQVASHPIERARQLPRPPGLPPYAQRSAIFTQAPFALAIDDAGGTLRYHNAALQALLGYTNEELRELQPPTLSHPDDLAQSLARIGEIRPAQRHSYVHEKRWRHRDGTWIWVRVTLTALRDGQGALQHTIAMVEDITARHQAEVALRHSEGRARALPAAQALAIMQTDGTA